MSIIKLNWTEIFPVPWTSMIYCYSHCSVYLYKSSYTFLFYPQHYLKLYWSRQADMLAWGCYCAPPAGQGGTFALSLGRAAAAPMCLLVSVPLRDGPKLSRGCSMLFRDWGWYPAYRWIPTSLPLPVCPGTSLHLASTQPSRNRKSFSRGTRGSAQNQTDHPELHRNTYIKYRHFMTASKNIWQNVSHDINMSKDCSTTQWKWR